MADSARLEKIQSKQEFNANFFKFLELINYISYQKEIYSMS